MNWVSQPNEFNSALPFFPLLVVFLHFYGTMGPHATICFVCEISGSFQLEKSNQRQSSTIKNLMLSCCEEFDRNE